MRSLRKILRYMLLLPQDIFFALVFYIFVLRFVVAGKVRFRKTVPDAWLPMVCQIWLKSIGRKKSELTLAEVTQIVSIFQNQKLPLWKWPLTVWALPDGFERRLFGTSSTIAHHMAREQLVKQHIPPAQHIIDLAGSVGSLPQGGLLIMGYTHQPKEVTIVDLPVELQETEYKEASRRRGPPPEIDHNGTRVRTVFSSMTDLSPFKDESIDLVWCGQGIEHIYPHEVGKTLKECHRVLKRGGILAFDTPNVLVSNLLTRVGFLHPEHKIEYAPAPIVDLTKLCGFQIQEVIGVSAMPLSFKLGRFFKPEIYQAPDFSQNADVGFSFFVKAVKI